MMVNHKELRRELIYHLGALALAVAGARLGDVFDMWLAHHRYFVDRYNRIIKQLVRLHDEGVGIHYFEGNHDVIREQLTHPQAVIGLGDGGAHCGLICDASLPTTMKCHTMAPWASWWGPLMP